jgi:hypothetical protein
MVGRLLLRGLAAGLLAAVAAVGFARLLGEPAVSAAIAFETARDRASGLVIGPDLVSRGVQGTIGLFTGLAIYSVAIGGLFALVFASVQGRLPGLRPRGLAGVLALLGYLLVVAVPAAKYPANPPAVGDPQTIGRRTGLYLTLLLVSLALGVAAAVLARRLTAAVGGWNAIVIAAGGFLLAVTVVCLLLPAVNEVPAGFPATVLWQFRMASLGTQAVLWAGLGLIFGVLSERADRPRQPPQQARTPTTLAR